MKPATHSGHCQACGRLQKLPSGVLSKHGYTVEDGYFSGTCRGAGELPYELSCDLIKGFIQSARCSLNLTIKTQEDLRQPAVENLAWIREYRPATWKRRYSSHVWLQTPVVKQSHKNEAEGYEWATYHYLRTNDDGTQKQERLPFYSNTPKDELDACTKLNSAKADWFEREVKMLRDYIQWQERRVREWAVRPLFPVAHKDKEGFEVANRA